MTKRAAVYVRQSVREDEGIERQLARCDELVSARGWTALPAYVDNDTSASKRRGPETAWARMLDDIGARRVDVVVAVNLDRLLRNIRDLSELLELGAMVVTVEGDLDLSTETGELQATVLAGAARFEVRRKASRTAVSAATRRADGHPSPGRVPYGFAWVTAQDRDAQGTRYVVVPEEAAVVRFMFAELLAGDKEREALGAICRELNKGTATLDGQRLSESSKRTRDGAPWGNSTVRRMLLNPLYAGLLPELMPKTERGERVHYQVELVDLDKCTPGAWEAIVSVDELRATRRALLDPSRLKHDGNTSRKWLLSGLARCDKCGGPVRSAVTKERYRGYRCVAGHFQRRAEQIDAYVEHIVLERLSAPDAASLVTPSPTVDIGALRAREASLSAQIVEAGQLIAQGWTAPEVGKLVAPWRAELDQISTQLAVALAVDPLASVIGADDVRSVWEGLTLARKRRIVSELLLPLIRQVGKGVRVHTLEGAAASVSIVWRKPGRSNVALPAIVNEAGYGLHPELSDGVRAALATALN